MRALHERMREAAGVLEEVSALYGYKFPNEAGWSAAELRHEAEHVESENTTGAFDGIGRGGPW